jgi:hypothetical protein
MEARLEFEDGWGSIGEWKQLFDFLFDLSPFFFG